MKEHPILFSGPMVAAILDGPKTQTRRVIKLGANCSCGGAIAKFHDFDWSRAEVRNNSLIEFMTAGQTKIPRLHLPFKHPEEDWEENPNHDTVCRIYPKWQHGDRLWVKETWFDNYQLEETPKAPVLPGGEVRVYYRADGIPDFEGEESEMRWRPSIFMPRWASRITLEVVSVRPERLQDISEADALAEGVGSVDEYRKLWDSINGKKHPWQTNDLVWAIEFRKVA